MRCCSSVLAGVVLGVSMGSGAQGAASYSFVNVADSSGMFGSFDEGGAVNASGMVAFRGILDGGGEGVYVWDGASVMPVADTLGDFASFERPSFNKGGTVAFGAGLDAGGAGIYTGTTAGGTTPVAETSGGYSALTGASINDAGTVSFVGTLDTGVSGVYTVTGGTTSTVVTDTGEITGFLGPTSLNNSGEVAFAAATGSAATELFIDADSVSVTGITADVIHPRVSLGGSGGIAYWASTGGVEWIGEAYHYGNIQWEAGGVRGFDTFGDPIAAGDGLFAFTATLESGASGIFVDHLGYGADELIGIGDALFGSTVVDLTLGLEGLNDSRDVAFGYELADGRSGIALAQIPGAGTGLVFAGAGCGLGLRRRRRGAGAGFGRA